MGKIDLKSFQFTRPRPNYNAGEILKKVRMNEALKKAGQTTGLVTTGFIDATMVTPGIAWSISEYIDFGFYYSRRPYFTWGLDGTAGIEYNGDNEYTRELPESLIILTQDEYQPALFIPRVIHWHITSGFYIGCYLLIGQVNPEVTEENKTVRIHYRFEGSGYKKELE